MLVKHKDTIIANIAKKIEDKPISVWGFIVQPDSS